MYRSRSSLESTGLDDGRTFAVLNGTAAGASSLKSLDNFERRFVSDLAEDDVATVQPRGDDGSDKELRAVAIENRLVYCREVQDHRDLRVGASVSHGQQTGLVVLELEVLVAELLAVDGLAAGSLVVVSVCQLDRL